MSLHSEELAQLETHKQAQLAALRAGTRLASCHLPLSLG
jgi:hypothetical protein